MEFKLEEQNRLVVDRLYLQRLYGFASGEAAEEFRFGIEEEYFLNEMGTSDAYVIPEMLFQSGSDATAGAVKREFLQNQVEVVTPPLSNPEDARSELAYVRRVLASIAGEHGYSLLACGTHPVASWMKSQQSSSPRYDEVMSQLQMIGRRNMLCGMHIHVEIPDPDRRVELMRRVMPYLPLFIALSTSSPFWQGQMTGLKGYRLAAYDELPRTGLPELLKTNEDYAKYVSALVESGAIPNESYLWWMVRPSQKHPTLELRAPDCCTLLDDAIALSVLFRTLVRHLFLNEELDEVDGVDRAIAAENKWIAQRYGIEGIFASRSGPISVSDFLSSTLELLHADAAALGCSTELTRCYNILERGTSADLQLAVYREAKAKRSERSAFAEVIEMIASRTLEVASPGDAYVPVDRL